MNDDSQYRQILDLITKITKTQEKTSKQMQETKKMFVELREQQAETAKQMEETAKQMKETDRQMEETDRKLNKLGRLYGSMSNNYGEVAEEFFYSSFAKTRRLGNLKYDDIGRNWGKRRDGIEEEYDIIMTNGNAIAIIEVKVKAHPEDVNSLDKKVKNFKKLFPIYKDFKIYGGLASMTMSKEVESELLKKGLYAIKRQGNHVEVVSPVL